eukprot:COSAG01_NODE_5694_length_4092_cov_11.524418_1_plen_133_part_10
MTAAAGDGVPAVVAELVLLPHLAPPAELSAHRSPRGSSGGVPPPPPSSPSCALDSEPAGRDDWGGRTGRRRLQPLSRHAWIGHFPQGVGFKVTYMPDLPSGVVGGRLWLTGFPLCFCEKYGKLARTDLKNERI